MIRFAQIAIAGAALAAAVPAQAADFLIDITSGTVSGKKISYGVAYSTINYTLVSTDGKSTLNARATGWTRDLGGNFVASNLVSWGANGLGVLQPKERTDGNYHTVDNANGWEFVTLQFDKSVTLQSAVLNPFNLGSNTYSDNDAFIARGFTSFGAAPTSASMKAIEASLNYDGSKQSGDTWFNSNSDDFKGAAKQTYNLSPSKVGNVWMIGGSVNGPDWRNDAFKLNSIAVTTPVPEPATWMTMILGFGAIGVAARRRRRGATTVAA